MLNGGGQFLDIHQDGSIATHADHGLVGMGHLGAYGRRQAVTHGARTARSQPAPRVLDGQMLRRPHLVLPDVRGHERVAPGDLPQFFDHEDRKSVV